MKKSQFQIVTEEKTPQAVLVGLMTDQKPLAFDRAMDELADLADSCGIEPVYSLTQKAASPTQATYIGSGKVEELKNVIREFEADLVIFDQTLSPMQFRNLTKTLNIEVMDRTGLILKIFSEHARTTEARLQVEYANLQYTLPRLAGMWSHFSRQAGSSGSRSSRGEGETQIELDRRYIERRMTELEKELKQIKKKRVIQREKRMGGELPLAALVGYTNAGKSTIMNRMLLKNELPSQEKEVLEENKLFATLDTTVRRISTGNHIPFLLTDTVGFIDELPHSLVKAFRSTLEEILYADLLIEVVDASDPEYRRCMEVTEQTLKEIGAGAIPVIHIFNKMDKAVEIMTEYPKRTGDSLYLCAKQPESIEALLALIEEKFKADYEVCSFLFPYSKGDIVSRLIEKYPDAEVSYETDGTAVNAAVSPRDRDQYRAYLR